MLCVEVKFSASAVEWRCGGVVSVKSGHQNSPVGLFGAQFRAFGRDSGLSFSFQDFLGLVTDPVGHRTSNDYFNIYCLDLELLFSRLISGKRPSLTS